MDRSIVFFDDICILCSWAVRLIIRNDRRARFSFASIGSDVFNRQVDAFKLERNQLPDSIILVHDGKIYTRSSAALRIAANLRFPWPLITVFYIVPRYIRDLLYDLVARKRYRWFGKRESCFVPGEGVRERML